MSRFVVEFGKDGLPPAQEGRLDAPAFHRNCEPIWQAISSRLPGEGAVLEIASGTGQHVTAYAPRAPRLTWYPSDIFESHLASIEAWRLHTGVLNVRPSQRIDLNDPGWDWLPGGTLAAMLCINLLHISAFAVSRNLIAGAARLLQPDGRLFVYGPFMRDGAHTAPSNAAFDASLRAQDSAWGLRDIADLAALASECGLVLAEAIPMPSNNFVLEFARGQDLTIRGHMHPEPIMDIAHLGHLELLTPTFEKSARFFVDVMGMTVSGEKGDSIYLRAYDDYERYSLKLTASKTSGMAHVAYRCRSPQALERRAAALKGSDFDVGWSDGDLGHGKTFVCKDPDGHVIELYFDTEWYEAPPELKPSLKNQAQRFPARGCNVRRLDHWNGLAADIPACRKFFEQYLGFRLTERIVLDDGSEAGIWFTTTNKSYDFAYTRDHTGARGRFHHVTYALNSREEVLLAADIFLENGVYIETGPHKHAVQQTFFLYVYEPGGNRVEVANAGARLVLAPDWKPITWTQAERMKGQAWGLKTIESFHTHGTPPVEHK